MASRRQLLKGVALTSFIAASGVSIWQLSLKDSHTLVEADLYEYQHLSLDDRLVLFAIIPGVLGEALEKVNDSSFTIKVIQQLDLALGFISDSSYEELRQLFDLLGNQLGRAYLAGVWESWNQADARAIVKFLEDWKTSYLTLLRSGYLGLHQLIMGTFYAQPESWKAINYQGPIELNLSDEFYQQFKL